MIPFTDKAVSGSIHFDRLTIPGLPLASPIEVDFSGFVGGPLILSDNDSSQAAAAKQADVSHLWAVSHLWVHSNNFQFDIPDRSCRARPSYVSFFIISDAITESPSTSDGDEFLSLVYKTEQSVDDLHAMELVVNKLDDLLNAGNFDSCKAIMLSAEPDRMSDALVVSFLGITLAAKKKLTPERDVFFVRSVNAVSQRRGFDGALKLLVKYR